MGSSRSKYSMFQGRSQSNIHATAMNGETPMNETASAPSLADGGENGKRSRRGPNLGEWCTQGKAKQHQQQQQQILFLIHVSLNRPPNANVVWFVKLLV